MPKHTIAVVTATRAEYGLLRPLLLKMAADDEVELRLLVTGAHLSPRYGNTVTEIEADGLPIAARLPILPEAEGATKSRDFSDPAAQAVAHCIAHTIDVFTDYFSASSHRPDALVLLGDRYEIFAVATAAAALRIPLCHISGGDVTLGAQDEFYRHCITKMSALHFPSCADSAARLLRLGESPDTVYNVGGLGDENIRTLKKMTRQELCESTGLDLMQPFALVTFHPETAGALPETAGPVQEPDPATQADALCAAMRAVKGVFWLITGSNADAGGQICSEKMQAFAAENPQRAAFVQSLGLRRYLSAMQYAALVAGNSSSGVVETPSFGVPTVNIGDRQAGRAICENVLCCPAEAKAIEAAMNKALTPEFATAAKKARSPYNGGDTSGKMLALLKQKLAEPDFGAARAFYDGDGDTK